MFWYVWIWGIPHGCFCQDTVMYFHMIFKTASSRGVKDRISSIASSCPVYIRALFTCGCPSVNITKMAREVCVLQCMLLLNQWPMTWNDLQHWLTWFDDSHSHPLRRQKFSEPKRPSPAIPKDSCHSWICWSDFCDKGFGFLLLRSFPNTSLEIGNNEQF